MERHSPTHATQATARLDELLAEHGELMAGAALWKAFGFKTERSFQRAALRGSLPVAVFTMQARRGRFARTRDVAAWLNNVIASK